MADSQAPTALKSPPIKGKAATPTTGPPKPTLCQSRILPSGRCEVAERAIKHDQNLRAYSKIDQDPIVQEWLKESWKRKDNIITEFAHRIKEWNDSKCHKCGASLKGWGPQVLDKSEMEYYEDPSLFPDAAALDKHMNKLKDLEEIHSTDAVALLKKILPKK